MKKSILAVTAAFLATAALTAHAADERNGRVIPLAEPTIFGYTQIIGDRLCLFDTNCSRIAEYSASSKVTNESLYSIYIVDDGSRIYFYDKNGLFLTLLSGTEYVRRGSYITVKDKDGYTAYSTDGSMAFLTAAEANETAERFGVRSEFQIAYNGTSFFIRSDDKPNIFIDEKEEKSEEKERSEEEKLLKEKLKKLAYKLGSKIDDDLYRISGFGSVGICDKDGNILLPPKYFGIYRLSNGMWVFAGHYDNVPHAIVENLTDEPKFEYKFVSELDNGLIYGAKFSGTTVYMNSELEVIYEFKGDARIDFESGRVYKTIWNTGTVLESERMIADMEDRPIIRSRDFLTEYMPTKGNLCYFTNYDTLLSKTDVVYLPPDAEAMPEHIIPPDTGEIKQPYYTTDIKVTIDGAPIQGYAINGRTLICLNDLEGHGFNAAYYNDTRMYAAKRDKRAEPYPTPVNIYDTVGEIAGYTVKSDIAAYVNGKYIETEAIDGKLLVEAEALCALYEDDPDYEMLSCLGISPYLMRCRYDDNTRTLAIETYIKDTDV